MERYLSKLTALAVLVTLIGFSGSAQLSPDLEQQLNNTPDTERIDVIIQTNGSNQQAVQAIRNAGGNVNKQFSIIDGVAVTIPKVAARNIAQRDFVERIDPDFEMKTVLDLSASQVDAEEAWSENATGEEVDVAVLDTGIAQSHGSLDLENQVDFTGEGTGDNNGHGTHVAGIIASTDDSYTGVSYDADLHSVKVLTSDGTGSASDVIEGIEYAAENNLDVISLSLGVAVEQCDGEDSLSEAINNAYSQGTVPVVAAGNEGPDSETITVPGCAENAVTVGSIGGDNTISSFSSRGPTADGRVKPDVVAPGETITSTWNDGGFTSKSGTSMATPHVSGTTAILLAENTSLTPSQLKSTIMETANDLGADENAQGSGLVDVYDSYQKVDTEENTTENTTEENETTGNHAPSIESLGVNTVEVNGSVEAEMTVNATDQDNETLEVTFYFEGEQTESTEGYGRLSFNQSNLSTNTTYNWSAEASDGINTTSTGTQEFTTGVIEGDEENETMNETENRTSKLPPQASDTARKATSGFFNPTSPFYGFDVAFDNAAVAVGLKSKEAVMEERAQEAKKMAAKGNTKGAQKAIKNLRNTAGNDENSSKEASEKLENVMEGAPEEAKQGLRNALENVEKERQRGKPQSPGKQSGKEANKSGQEASSNDKMERRQGEDKGDSVAGNKTGESKKNQGGSSMKQEAEDSSTGADAKGSANTGTEGRKGNSGAEAKKGPEADSVAQANTGSNKDSSSNMQSSDPSSKDPDSSKAPSQESSQNSGTGSEGGSKSADSDTSKTSGSQSTGGADKGSQDTSSSTDSGISGSQEKLEAGNP